MPEWIFEHRFHAVELIFGFGDELHAFGLQFCEGLAAIGGAEGSSAEHAFLQECGHGVQIFRVILFPVPPLSGCLEIGTDLRG